MKLHTFFPITLLLFIFVLSGCAAPAESTGSKQEESNDSNTSASESKTLFGSQDPDRQPYFSCQNIDSDIYMNASIMPGQSFTIFSLQPLDTEQIHVSVPVQTDYTVSVSEIDPGDVLTTEYLQNLGQPEGGHIFLSTAFPYYLYQCYRETDWKKMTQLYKAAEEAEKSMNGLTSSDPEYARLQETIDSFRAYRDFYQEDFKALTAEDLPVFYLYTVQIFFGFSETSENPVRVSERFQTIEIQIGEETYTQNIGEIRLHAEDFPEGITSLFADTDHLKNLAGISSAIASYPWGDRVQCRSMYCFQALEDLTITGLYLYESDLTLIGAHVTTSDKSPVFIQNEGQNEGSAMTSVPNTSVDFYWDLTSPLDIPAETYVTIDLIFQDPRLAQLEYGGRFYPVMEYTAGTDSHAIQTEMILDRLGYDNCWLYYAIVFDGLDMEPYFQDYYRPVYESWRENIPW